MVKKNSKNYLKFLITTAGIFLLGLILTLCDVTAADNTGGFVSLISFLLAFMPILLVLIGMLGFDLSALKVSPFAFVLAVLLSITYFTNATRTGVETASVLWSSTWSGIVSAIYIVGLIFFSFLILDMMQTSGAMDIVKGAISRISGDRRVQLIIIGLFVPIFMEGAAGAGTPAAIAAPFLVGLGFDPIMAVVVALMSDGVCTSFGGSGLTTLSGGTDVVTAGISTTDLNFAMAGWMHMIGILVMPMLILAMSFGKKGFKGKGIVGWALYCGIMGAILMLVFSNFIGGFITDMGVGLVGITFAILGLKIFKIETPKELFYQIPKSETKPKYSVMRALSPYIFILLILPITLTVSKYINVTTMVDGVVKEITLWTVVVKKITYNGWIDILLCICSILSIITLRYGFKTYCTAFVRSFKKVIGVFVIMGSLLAVANIMKITYTVMEDGSNMSMIKLLALDISNVAGVFYPAAAVLIGGIGAFITGTNLGSNQLFANMHMAASTNLGINQITVFAAQNGGGSLGNMICPNNVTAACATVDITGQESKVMKRVALMFLICCVLYMLLGMFYTYVVFPHIDVNTVNLFTSMG